MSVNKLLLTFLMTYSVFSTLDASKVQLAVIVPSNCRWLFCWARISPALYLALETVNHTMVLEQGIQVRQADSECSAVTAPLMAFDFYRRSQASVFFGPVCDYSLAPVARYASYWQVPVISPGGMAYEFGKPVKKATEYNHLTRIGWSFNSLSRALFGALTHHSWSKLLLMFDQVGLEEIMARFCFLSASGIIEEIKGKGLGFQEDIAVFNSRLDKNLHVVDDLLKRKLGLHFSGK